MSMRKYISYLFRDPLLLPQYLTNERTATPITLTNIIDINVEGDPLLNLYITQLDKEVFSCMPEGLGPLGEAMWVEDNWTELASQMADEIRKHGWCVVQFYEDNPNYGRWHVYSVNEFSQWKTRSDDDGKLIREGIKFVWSDDLGNQFDEDILFDEAYLVKWCEGNGMNVFAFPELSQAVMTLMFEFRQMRGQLTFSAAKPSFKWFGYGPDADDTNIDTLDTRLKGIDNTSAIGAPLGVLESIQTIKDESLDIIEPALDKQLQYIAGLTRLPVSYFMGERTAASGMNGKGDTTDMLKIRQKKESIFNTIAPSLIKMFREEYGIDIDPEMPQDETLDGVEEDSSTTENSSTTEE